MKTLNSILLASIATSLWLSDAFTLHSRLLSRGEKRGGMSRLFQAGGTATPEVLKITSSSDPEIATAEEDHPTVKNVVAVSSCKGGVGKSTVSVNLAFALRDKGFKVGILDMDVHGPSLPTMVHPPDADPKRAIENTPEAAKEAGRPYFDADAQVWIPGEVGDVKLNSWGFVVNRASIVRGPLVVQLVRNLAMNTAWGDLDYLIVDMPPGTGDVQLTLAQEMNVTAAVVVTTPQKLAFTDVVKGIEMFDIVKVPSVAVVENMAYYSVPDEEKISSEAVRLAGLSDEDLASEAFRLEGAAAGGVSELRGEKREELLKACLRRSMGKAQNRRKQYLFGYGHGQRIREMWGIQNCVQLPLVDELAAQSDHGRPFVEAYGILEKEKKQRLGGEDGRRVMEGFNTLADMVTREVDQINRESEEERRPVVMVMEATNELAVGYKGEMAQVAPKDLRSKCRCALCVEEMTGRQKLDPNTISDDIRALRIGPVGNYAIFVEWSDGHKSIYPYKTFVPNYE
uniref:Gamma-butyrobetaine hydroxylase-like N-terminal domain-containing protein n=1 Tax=Chromera velia CCMP2878 TaxID=1169474 RepID=A0A0G4FIP2_9ALVE|mmetsp:Transcript_8091/g.15802  ORF Transcript_8091/g.15802 Transcript_8091/m.15802 type:complete len:512 (+) Transcript_8091:136-1671(+)|eukprot:Cvel_17212.t1-p1 / transcript=Cvel_17212.t1 / gene=Cvel_17212 / organism=Chromera_velia_CCMP2878 / gene_product=Protein mrp homolog, putative / transcript_product=Protein mrp homolog, putative / location=Cvel_scaffold1361:31938-39028(-) / protein_length=511 / sequence_SO=supercontig / SO=protein_coding / is_pseudo=false